MPGARRCDAWPARGRHHPRRAWCVQVFRPGRWPNSLRAAACFYAAAAMIVACAQVFCSTKCGHRQKARRKQKQRKDLTTTTPVQSHRRKLSDVHVACVQGTHAVPWMNEHASRCDYRARWAACECGMYRKQALDNSAYVCWMCWTAEWSECALGPWLCSKLRQRDVRICTTGGSHAALATCKPATQGNTSTQRRYEHTSGKDWLT